GHGQRVQRLEQERAEAAHEHRGVGMDFPDGAVIPEPPWPVSCRDSVASSRSFGAGDPREDLLAQPIPYPRE
ncbi:MAG: hypothetical protein WAK18_18880, partial [Nocardioidaceae bacterium]